MSTLFKNGIMNTLKTSLLFVTCFSLEAAQLKTVFSKNTKKKASQSTTNSKLKAESNRSPVDEIKFSVLLKDSKSTNDVIDQMSQMEALRSSAESSLNALMKNKPQDLELNLRMSELVLQRARDFEQFSLELSLLGNEAKAQELHLQSLKLFERGLAQFRNLLPRVAKHPLEGDIYLGMARSLKSLGKTRDALNTLARVDPRRFNSRTQFFMALVKGDLEFSLSNANGARIAYEVAQKHSTPGSQEDLYLTYKMAWVLYNLKDTSEAISLLKKVIVASKDKLALSQEAVQDFSLFVADLNKNELESEGNIKGVYKYLTQYSRAEIAEKAIEKLSETYAQNGRRSEAQKSLEFLIDLNSSSHRNGQRAIEVVKYDHDLVDTKNLTNRYFWLIKNFGPLSSWYNNQKLRPDIQRNTADSIEENLREYSVGLHKEANSEKSESRRVQLEETIASLYDAHIENFKEVPRIHYYRAEIYRRQNNFSKAATHYDNFILTLLAYDESKLEEFDHKIKKESAYASVEMWAKAIDKDPKLTENMVRACDRYLQLFPKDPKAPTVALDAARVEFKAGHPEIALKRIQKVVSDYPQSPESAEAVNAGLDILNKQGDFVNLALYARGWREKVTEWAPEKKKDELRTDLDKVLFTSEAKSCEEISKSKLKKLEAALCFKRVAENNPDSDIAPKSLVLASDLFKEFGDPFSSLEALEILVQKHPNSPQAVVAFSKLAEGFERTFQFVRSAEIYEKLLTRKDVPNRKQVIQRLAALYTGLSESKKLETLLQDADAGQELKNQVFAKQLKLQHDELLQLERSEGFADGTYRSPRAQEIFNTLKALDTKGKLPTHLALEIDRIEGHFIHSRGNLAKADEMWMAGMKKFWRSSPKTPDLWESAARMRLSQGSYWRTLFKSAEMASNPQRKASLFQKIEAWNTEVMGLNSPAVALETLWLTSQLYKEFADELKKNPATEKLGKDMELKSMLYIQQLAKSAQNWGIISPLLISVLKEIRQKRGESVQDISINFPWPEVPRGLDMSAARLQLKEWMKSPESLSRQLSSTKDRRAQKDAAFVLLMKKNTRSGINLQGWEDMLTQKDEVQARVQAALNDMLNDRAEMVLSQYDSIYGDDLFSAIARSELEVSKREYSMAYKRALSLFDRKEFAAKYYAIGWKSLFDELIDGKLSDGFKEEAFEVLQKVADKPWEKKLLATLCIKGSITCKGSYIGPQLINLLNSGKTESLVDYADHRSLWRIEKEFLELAIPYLTRLSTQNSQVEELRKAITKMKTLEEGTDNSKLLHRSAVAFADELDSVESKITARLDAERKPAKSSEGL